MDQTAVSQNRVTERHSALRAKNKLGLYSLIGIALVALVVVLTSVSGTRADFASLRSHNVPTDHKALRDAFPKAGENAASVYDAVFDRIYSQQDREMRRAHGDVSSAVFFNPNFDSDASGSLIASSSRMVDIANDLSLAARQGRCVYSQPIVATLTPDNRYSRPVYGYREASDAAQFLGGMAVCCLLKKEPDQGIEYLIDAKRVVGQLSKNPGSESFSAWKDTADVYFRAWGAFAKIAADDRNVIEQLAPVSSSLPMANIKQMASGDFPDNLVIYRKAQNDPDDYKMLARRSFEDKITDFKPFMRQGVNEVIHEWRTVFESLPDQSEDGHGCKEVFLRASDDFESRYPASDVLLNPFKEYLALCDDYATVLAEQRVMQTASNILSIRSKTGHVPDAIPPDGENVIDPCTGNPLIYYKEGNGFKLYSVGPDGQDDFLRAVPARFRDDVVFELEDLKMRPDIPVTSELLRTMTRSRENARAARTRVARQLGLRS